MDLLHAKAEFEASRLSEVVAVPSTEGGGWLLLHSVDETAAVMCDHSGRERLFHSLDYATEVGLEIGFSSVRVEERF